MAAVLAQLDNVSQLFGRFPALRKISVSFASGRCYVLLGENGAGKSTLLRVLAGLLEPTMGTARIFSQGKPEKIADQRARIGYMLSLIHISGDVAPNSIQRSGTNAHFVLSEQGHTLQVSYQGIEPPPDTFKEMCIRDRNWAPRRRRRADDACKPCCPWPAARQW